MALLLFHEIFALFEHHVSIAETHLLCQDVLRVCLSQDAQVASATLPVTAPDTITTWSLEAQGSARGFGMQREVAVELASSKAKRGRHAGSEKTSSSNHAYILRTVCKNQNRQS